MFHRPVEEVWQGLDTKSTFPVQPREEHRREKVKPLQIPEGTQSTSNMLRGYASNI